ncbi:urate hydroxylase PuuD [Allosphingosinicella sp.]|uniref:urate hydroxylase PuuD n=1 Tax=Allosphingosinicella sp. TaxID=2823234 RepID=UPI003783A152
MHIDWSEWLNLALRWLHLITGIAWIGSSFYFVWLDNHLQKPASGDASGELWSVHGGGFYHNQKYQVAPASMPEHLHWFKYEAYFTWISGFSLLVLIYYFGAQSYLIDPTRAQLSTGAAIAIGLSALAIGWLVYDLLCRSPLGQNNLLLGIFWFVCLLFAAHLLNSLFNPRAAYIHVGAIIGTAMVANVFLIIIPNQKKVVADLIAGRTPDPKLGAQAKQRSLHNNYMTLPVLLIMLSNHYPMTYGAERPWLVLALLGLTGVAIRHVFNLRGRGKPAGWAIGLAVVLAAASVTYVTLEKGSAPSGPAENVTYAQIAPLIAAHCAGCHNVPTPPKGVALDSYEHVRANAARVRAMAVDSQAMPLGNPTHMTPAERQRIGAWIAAGTPR